jgi:hypothetical protein
MFEQAAAEHTRDKAVYAEVEVLRERVERLEEAVAALVNPQVVEDRVIERVAERLQSSPPAPADAEPIMTRTPVEDAALPINRASVPSRRWLLVDFLAELRTILRMFFDIHYQVAWTTRVIALVLVPLILLSDWWVPFSSVPVVGPLVSHTVGLFLAFLVYKSLSREAQRYVQRRTSS